MSGLLEAYRANRMRGTSRAVARIRLKNALLRRFRAWTVARHRTRIHAILEREERRMEGRADL